MDAPAALNYSPHAIEDLERRAIAIRKKGLVKSAAALEQASQLLRLAVKFNLPANGDLIALEKLDEAFSEFVRLPFDAVALETPLMDQRDIHREDDVFKESPSSRRISLCWSQSFAEQFPALCPMTSREGGFYIASVYFDDDIGQWLMCPLANYIPDRPTITRGTPENFSENERLEHEFLLKKGAIKRSNSGYEAYPVQLCPEFVQMHILQSGDREGSMARLAMDLRDETHVAFAFCLTVNASNITRERIPAPEKLNKKRIKNGKPPFFETWVLDLKPSRPGPSDPSEGPAIEGARLSPRLHLRRGHIRRLDAERIIFVRATAVGSPRAGQVEKVYRVGK